ncbi:MAG TPA: ATP-binding protein [Gaiellaceae bacterium]|nr:ATP-binding protein [Gaiellaceae bacterium]
MLARLPIRLRLTAAFALVMAIVLVATGLFLYFRFQSELDDTVNRGLRSRGQDVARLVQQSNADLSKGSSTGLLGADQSFAQVLTLNGRVVDSSPAVGDQRLLGAAQVERARQGPILFDRGPVGNGDDPARVLALPVDAQASRVLVAVGTSLEARGEALEELQTQLLIGLPLALLLASIAGYVLTGAALRPVESMRRRAAGISGGEPGERLPVPEPHDEIRRLGETLNEMLGRIEATIRRERRFVADASHELRTPLAMLRTELELAGRRERTREELADALRSAGEETERLSRLADDLLVLARAEDGRLPVQTEDVPARELLERAASRFLGRAHDAGREITVEPSQETVRGDRVRLEQALGNLVDNALRHGAGNVKLHAVEDTSEVELHVTDEGSGFPAGFLPHAFDRFARADEARGGRGSGLGLSIVEVIARAHGGSAHVVNRNGGGVDAWIAVPIGEQDQP